MFAYARRWFDGRKSILFPMLVLFVTLLILALFDWRNFDGDQAIAGLMSRHWLHGEFAVYPWGQRYFGMLIIPLMSACMLFLGEESILAFRLPQVCFAVFFLGMVFSMVAEIWGRKTAIRTVWWMAVPGPFILMFLYIHLFSMFVIVGIGAIWLCLRDWPSEKLAGLRRAFVLGVLFGLGYWLTPSFLEYVLVCCVTLVLRAHAWCDAWKRMRSDVDLSIGGVRIVLITLVSCALASATLLLVNGGSHTASLIGFCILAALMCVLMLLFLYGGCSWIVMCMRAFCVLLGCAIGNAPQWMEWLWSGILPESRLEYVIPQARNLVAMTNTLLPALAGIDPVESWSQFSAWHVSTLSVSLMIVAIGLVAFAWTTRSVWNDMFSGASLTKVQAANVAMILLFLIPVVSLAMRGADNVGQIRYLLDAWFPFSLMIVLGWQSLGKRRSIATWIVASHVIVVGVTTAIWMARYDKNDAFRPDFIAELETTLQAYDTHGGYANYWSAFPIDFLTGERLIFAPYYGSDRRHEYHDLVEAMSRFALLVNTETVSPYPQWNETARFPSSLRSAKDLSNALQQRGIVDPYYKKVTERLDHAQVLHRTNVGVWDLWILQENDS